LGPKKFVEFDVRDNGGPSLDENFEQFVHFGLERHDHAVAPQLPCGQVEVAITK